MIKKLCKKAGAVFLAVMLSLSIMPMTNVFAAGSTYNVDELQVGDVLETGDLINNGSAPGIAVMVYNEDPNPDSSTNSQAFYSPATPYTIGSYYEHTKWVVESVNKNPINGKYNLSLEPYVETADITVTTDGNGTASADVTEASEGDTVTLTATPNTGYTFKEWQSDDVTVTNNQFTMPNKAVSVKAIFEATVPVERSATMSNIEITGSKGEFIWKNITVTLTNDKLADDMDISAEPTSNLPNGISLGFGSASSNQTFTIGVSGTPTAGGKGTLELTIPGEWLESGEDLKVTSNPNAKFDIVAPSATIENVEIKGVVGEAVDKDITVTLENDELADDMDVSIKPTSNLPAGIKLGFGSDSSNQKFKISVSGTPTTTGNGTLELTIPGAWLKSGEDLKVTANSNAKYDFANIKVTAGAGSTHKTGGNDDLTFTCNGSLANLTGIYVDGALLDPSNYTVKSGSTILTLKASYLNTLAVGTHTLKFQYKNDMSTDTSFEIVKADDKKDTPIKDTGKTNTPQTGDTTNIALLMSLLVLSGGAVAFVTKKRKMATKR